MNVLKEVYMNPWTDSFQLPLISRQQLEAVPLYTNVSVKQTETTELSYFLADLLCETDAEEILNLYWCGLLHHI
jgi:hypothetical protein